MTPESELEKLRDENERYKNTLEECRKALEPFDDIKPRGWITDFASLARVHRLVKWTLTLPL